MAEDDDVLETLPEMVENGDDEVFITPPERADSSASREVCRNHMLYFKKCSVISWKIFQIMFVCF